MVYYTYLDIGMGVAVGDNLVNQYKPLLNYVFAGFALANHPTEGLKYLALYSNSDQEIFPSADSSVVFDPPQESAFFFFTGVIKEFLKTLPGITVLHGGAIRLNGENWLILAPRRHGKSTLISYLALACGADYMDDDTVVIANHKYYGFCFPIYSRSVDPMVQKKVVGITLDADNERRYVTIPTDTVKKMDRIDRIIFPHYAPGFTYTSKRQIRGIELIKRLVENCAYYSNQRECLAEFSNLALTGTAYDIEYSSFDWIESTLLFGG